MNENTKEVHEFKVVNVLADGEHSAIEAHTDATTADGHRIRIEEVGLQTWKDRRIVRERYFYAPSNIEGKAKEINALH